MKSTFYPVLLLIPVLCSYSVGQYAFGGDPTVTHQHASFPTGNTPHPPGLPSVWKGRNVSELVARLGEPTIILDTAVRGFVIYGDTPSVMYVYVRPGGGAYDAYVVEHDTGEILAYQRR
jgi:hypothetical protein